MNTEQLETFLEVMRRCNVKDAAKFLGISQSTASFRIRSLEGALEVKLFDRGPGGMLPTEAADALMPRARQILQITREAMDSVRADDGEPEGELTLAASTIPAEYLLPPILARFRRSCPAVRVRVDVYDSQRAVSTVLAGDCELGFVGVAPDDDRVEATRFATDSIVLVACSDLPGVPASSRVTPKSLQRLPLIRRRPGSGTRGSVDKILGANFPGIMEVGSTEAIRRCVMACMGVAFISESAVAPDIEVGRLRRLAFPRTPLRRAFHMVRLARQTPSRNARAFIACTGDNG